MSTTVLDTDSRCAVTFEEVPHAPGAVFLTVRTTADVWPNSTYQPTCVMIDRAELVLALCREFDLISQLALFLNREDQLEALDWVDRNAHPAD